MTPAEELRAAAVSMRSDADALEEEMRQNPRYWGNEVSDAAYANGVRGGLGGAAGEAAARWTPGMFRSVATLLESEAHAYGRFSPEEQVERAEGFIEGDDEIDPSVAVARAFLSGGMR